MLYNKNQFKKLNDKKVLHKIKKHWVTVSVALLGLLGVKSIATHTNVNADVSADNAQANHQLSSQSIKSTASLVPNKAVGVTSTSTQPSSSAMHSASTSSVAANSSSASALQPKSTASSSAANVSGSVNVASAAQQIHDHVLGEYADNNQAAQTKRLLGGANLTTQNTDNFISNLLNPNNLTHIANDAQETHNANAYNDIISKLNANTMTSLANNGATIQQYINYAKAIGNDVSQIASADPSLQSKVSSIMNTVNEAQGGIGYLKTGTFTINSLASALQDPDNLMSPAHQGLSKWMVEGAVEALPNRQQMINATSGMATIASNSTDASDYQHMVNDIKNLNTANHEDQVNALNQLSTDTETLAESAGDATADNLGLAKIANDATSVANNIQISDKLNTLHAGSLFNDVISYVTTNNDYSKLNSLANDAKADFSNATNASDFINQFTNQLTDVNNAQAPLVKTELTDNQSNPEIANAYTVAKSNANDANNILGDLANLNANNAVNNLSSVSQTINNNGSLNAVGALNDIANSASTEATSVSESNAYKGLLNNESTLFSGIVNRINARGFNSNAFNTLVGNVKNDLANAANVSDFANNLNDQDDAFDGITAQKIKGYLNNLKNNPEFSNAYQAVRTSSDAADSILDDLSGMNSNNEVAKLSDIANVAKNNFSNSASFGSLATDAFDLQTSVANVKNETPTEVTNDIKQANQKANDLLDNVNTTKTNMGKLASNYDGQQASTEMNAAVSYANDAKSYAHKAATDALAETGVHVTELGLGTPDYVEDVRQVNNDVSKGSVALTSAKTDVNLSQIDTELSNLNVKGLFNGVLNYVVGHNDYGKFNQAITAAKDAFSSKNNVTDFVNDFSNRIAGLTNGNAVTIKQLLKNHESDLTSAYQVAKDNRNVVDLALNDLSNLTSANASNQLNVFHNELSNNGTFKQFNSLKQVAQVASDQANQINKINQINSLVNSLINPSFVKGAVQRLVDEPENKRSDFKQLVSDAESALAKNANASDFINSIENDQNFKKFTGNKAATVKSVLNGLNNSLDSSIVNGYYNQVKAQKNNVDLILDNLSKIADNPYESNASQNKSLLNDIYGTINSNSDLKSVPGFNNVATGMNDAESSTTFVPNKAAMVTPSIQSLDNMLQPILSRIVAKGFNGSAFRNAIGAVESNIQNANTLSDLWNDVKSNSGVQYFVGNHGKITQSIISKLSDTNSPLEAAYKAGHRDSAVTQILNDLSDISKHQQIGNGEAANKSDINAVNRDLNDINNQINHSSLKQIAGAQTLMNYVHYSATVKKNPSTPTVIVKPDVSSIEPLISRILSRITAVNFDSHDFDNVIAAVKSNIKSAPSLSTLWSDVDNNQSGVKHFTGSLDHDITEILNNGSSQTMKALNAAYQQAHANNHVTNVLTDLQAIADNHLDANNVKVQNSKRDAIRAALADVKHQLSDPALSSIKGVNQIVSDVKNGINNKLYKDQPDSSNKGVEPHYADKKFNNDLNYLINGYTMQKLADHLASKAFAQSGERPAFNQILKDLANLPNNSNVNGDLSDISKLLNDFRGPLSKLMAKKVQGLIQDIEANDKTPDALAAYADGLKNTNGDLINDLNKGLQDVKSGQNNADYKNVLSDLIDLDTNPADKDHDLAKIAYTIKHGDLRRIPLLKNVAQTLHQIAKRDNDRQRKNKANQKPAKKPSNSAAVRREQAAEAAESAHQQHMANRKAAEQTSERDKSKRAEANVDHQRHINARSFANNKHKKDMANYADAEAVHQQHMKSRSVADNQYRQDVAHRKGIQKDQASEVNKDISIARNDDYKAVIAASEATRLANSAQNYITGYKPGYDSNKARIYGNQAIEDAGLAANTFTFRAINYYNHLVSDGDNISSANADLNDVSAATSGAINEINDINGNLIAASEYASQAGSVSNSASQPSNGNSGASNSSSASQPSNSASQSGNSNGSSMSSNNPTSFTPSTSGSVVTPNSASHSNSNTPIIIINGSQSSSTAPYTPRASAVPQNSGLVTFASTASSTPASTSQSRTSNGYALFNKINNDNSMVTADLVSAMKDFKNPAIKRDPKITSRVQSDEKMLSQIQNQVDRDLSHPSQRAVVNANDCAVRAGLVANDAKMLLASAEGYNGNHVDNQNDDFNRYGHGVTKGASSEPNPGYESTGRQNGTVQDAMDDNAEGVESSSSSNNNESANDQNGSDKLPQTGEVQDNAAFVIMGLIALSVALTSALGADLTKKRRHE